LLVLILSQATKLRAVREVIQNNLNDANDQAIDAIIRTMRTAALNACRVFAARHEDSDVRYWGVLNGVEQLNMLETMQAELIGVDPRLVFFENFIRLWPLEFVLQPRWTQRSRRARNTRLMAMVRGLDRENQYQTC
jgi:hypothetical protein